MLRTIKYKVFITHLRIIPGTNKISDGLEITSLQVKATRVTFVINFVKQYLNNIFKTILYTAFRL